MPKTANSSVYHTQDPGQPCNISSSYSLCSVIKELGPEGGEELPAHSLEGTHVAIVHEDVTPIRERVAAKQKEAG